MDSIGRCQKHARLADELLVRALRASDAAHRELAWFFGPAACDIEPPSNYDLIVQQATYGGGRGRRGARTSEGGVEARADALHTARIIHERLRGVPRRQVAVLQTLYTPVEWPQAVQELCGWLTPLVCELSRTQRNFEKAEREGTTFAVDRAEWLEEWTERHGPSAALAALEQAHGLAARALAAYEAVRGSGPSVAPDDEGGN